MIDSEKKFKQELRVWWIPQVPMSPPFHVPVSSVEEAAKILGVLADYDLYQWHNNIKPDFANAGGLELRVSDDIWEEWHHPDTDEDINDLIRRGGL